MSVKALSMSLPPEAFQTIAWREVPNAPLRERFAAVRVRHAGGNVGKACLRPEQWLLFEWPAHEAEPSKYFLSTLPETSPSTNSSASPISAGVSSAIARI